MLVKLISVLRYAVVIFSGDSQKKNSDKVNKRKNNSEEKIDEIKMNIFK